MLEGVATEYRSDTLNVLESVDSFCNKLKAVIELFCRHEVMHGLFYDELPLH